MSDLLENFRNSQFRGAEYGFDIEYLKFIFRQIGPKFKTSPDLLENFQSRDLEGVECRTNMNILRYFIQKLNLDNWS